MKFKRPGAALKFALCLVGLGLFLSGCGYVLGLRLNVSRSLPVGLWRLDNEAKPRVGDYVVFFLPVDNPLYPLVCERAYFAVNMPLLKKLVAGPGDRIEVGEVVYINGIPVPNGVVRTKDMEGRPIGPADSTTLLDGHFWAMSDYNDMSFDSRYFGAVPLSVIRAVARPVFVF